MLKQTSGQFSCSRKTAANFIIIIIRFYRTTSSGALLELTSLSSWWLSLSWWFDTLPDNQLSSIADKSILRPEVTCSHTENIYAVMLKIFMLQFVSLEHISQSHWNHFYFNMFSLKKKNTFHMHGVHISLNYWMLSIFWRNVPKKPSYFWVICVAHNRSVHSSCSQQNSHLVFQNEFLPTETCIMTLFVMDLKCHLYTGI